ncbi:MAG: hypothetical protein RLZZ306_1759, partial [Bacteroidota bacterium]
KILFSRKVILVEGANDILVYKYLIEKYVENLTNDKKYAETYLNFLNMAIIVHQGKPTAWILILLCKHFKLDYFAINDLDFDEDLLISELSVFQTEQELKDSSMYESQQDDVLGLAKTKRGKLTTNWKLLYNAGEDKIHFNIPKLEAVLNYGSNDKDSLKIWNKIQTISPPYSANFFPEILKDFLEFKNIITIEDDIEIQNEDENDSDDLPF